MRRLAKIFMAYFPVILIGFQIIINLMALAIPKVYYSIGFYLSLLFGTNLLFALFLVVFCHMMRFCFISRWAAYAQLLFAANYLVIQQDNLYNIMFQIIVGVVALIITFWHYVNKFPLCKLSLLAGFFYNIIFKSKCDCEKGIEAFDRKLKEKVLKHHDFSRPKPNH
jgi:hypothetical protein